MGSSSSTTADQAELTARLRETIPALAEGYRRSITCLYTNTPDEHFAFGFLPRRRSHSSAIAVPVPRT